MRVGSVEYREALREMFGLRTEKKTRAGAL
jgi:hypothetical protein